ncbi:ribose-phosphate diphosphokinase [Seongchinamella unica]|uniref:Ribose-phosphate diphosphokinase n=1 Tax=Seongchinamella unica TaxID=2547392 RepID=A0A4R5LRK9_9GAMM|nr:ribose-phosphate diphosphokinase [Seongchinamella unica]TDG13347.1 ribose-phosphate diphosphokinase [Seongchinamella unica]
MLVLGFTDSNKQATELAAALGVPHAGIEVHRFPDGESRVCLPPQLPEHVVLFRSLHYPNEKLLELMLATESARTLGAREVTLVAPYLCYMRQDKAFHPGEAVSQRIVGRFLADLFDTLVTVDPHLHRVHDLAQAVPVKRAFALSAAPAMGQFLTGRKAEALLVGPDQESEQWVSTVARGAGLAYAVASKTRHGDREVDVRLPPRDYTDLHAVLVDDMASTGRTLAAAARALLDAGAARVDVLVTHALFVGDALEVLRAAGISEVWSSDSIPHASNAFALAADLARSIAPGRGETVFP